MRGAGQCEFKIDLPPDLSPVRGDRAQLIQLFDNLLSNAVRYSPAGSTVTVSARAARRGELEFSVADQGIGIEPDEREREIRRLLVRQAHLRALGRRSPGETFVRSMRRLFAPTAFGPAAEDEELVLSPADGDVE